MKKLIRITALILAILALMYAEYRYIMTHQHIYHGEDNTIYAEVFGQVDEYCIEKE